MKIKCNYNVSKIVKIYIQKFNIYYLNLKKYYQKVQIYVKRRNYILKTTVEI